MYAIVLTASSDLSKNGSSLGQEIFSRGVPSPSHYSPDPILYYPFWHPRCPDSFWTLLWVVVCMAHVPPERLGAQDPKCPQSSRHQLDRLGRVSVDEVTRKIWKNQKGRNVLLLVHRVFRYKIQTWVSVCSYLSAEFLQLVSLGPRNQTIRREGTLKLCVKNKDNMHVDRKILGTPSFIFSWITGEKIIKNWKQRVYVVLTSQRLESTRVKLFSPPAAKNV